MNVALNVYSAYMDFLRMGSIALQEANPSAFGLVVDVDMLELEERKANGI